MKLESEVLSLYMKNAVLLTDPYHINLIGIRHSDKVNSFNDELYYLWMESNGCYNWEAITKGFTTDPGNYYLEHPMNSKGTAILKEGFYPEIWKLGYHSGKYEALVQNSEVKVYRDNNKDLILDFINDDTASGINLHRANEKLTSVQVDKWSAGCQVIADPYEYALLIAHVQVAISHGQTVFPYLLLNNDNL